MSVMVLKKIGNAAVVPPFLQLVTWLVTEQRMIVFVEAAAVAEPNLLLPEGVRQRLVTFTAKTDDLTDKIDFVMCLGGDGTLLYAATLFQRSVPPIMAFHFGSLGFLTQFHFDQFEAQVTQSLYSF